MIISDYHVEYCTRNSLDKTECIYPVLLNIIISGNYHVKYCFRNNLHTTKSTYVALISRHNTFEYIRHITILDEWIMNELNIDKITECSWTGNLLFIDRSLRPLCYKGDGPSLIISNVNNYPEWGHIPKRGAKFGLALSLSPKERRKICQREVGNLVWL